jgi:hypothetical protein
MEKSLIGRRYVVKDNSYIKDLSGNCKCPLLCGQEGIIIHHPYTECHNGRIHLFVDIVIPNNTFYKYHYRVLFFEWGLLDKVEREQNKNAVLGLVGAIYHPTYNSSFCCVLGQDLVEGYLSGVDCEILSLPYYKTFQSRFKSDEIKRVSVINVRSLETGIEYIIEYKVEWLPKYGTTFIPKEFNNDDEWNFCPHCGKKLR